MTEKKHARLERLDVTTKQNRVNASIQIGKQKLQATKEARQTIGGIDGVPQIIVIFLQSINDISFILYLMFETLIPSSSDVNVFSIVELLRNSVHDPKSTDIATDCGTRIYTCVNFLLMPITE